jgi:hypothetical protein
MEIEEVLATIVLDLSMSFLKLKLVVYIPTYVDYKLAALQAKRLKNEFHGSSLELKVIISVNSVNLSQEDICELNESCDTLIYLPENLGGDTNINLGFIWALREHADFFWVLSANDLLRPGAVNFIERAIENCSTDLLVVSSSMTNSKGSFENAFLGKGAELPLGLISAVIYRSEVFREAFASSLKFAWTGWGQLSVIQNTLFEVGSISYEIIDVRHIYDRVTNFSEPDQLIRNQSNYRHSFFGYPLVVSILFNSDEKMKNRIIRHWLWNNWYKIGFFKKGHSPYQAAGETAKDVFWTGNLARRTILRSGVLSPVLYLIGVLPIISKMQGIRVFQEIKTRMYRKPRKDLQ